MVLLIILLCLAHNGFRPIMDLSDDRRRELVEAACEYLYRLRPLVEWTAYNGGGKGQDKDPKQFLYECLPIIAAFQVRRADLVKACRIPKRALVVKAGVQQWLSSGTHSTAFFRAQLLIVGVSAIMHRIGSPSPGRDFFLPAGVSTGR